MKEQRKIPQRGQVIRVASLSKVKILQFFFKALDDIVSHML